MKLIAITVLVGWSILASFGWLNEHSEHNYWHNRVAAAQESELKTIQLYDNRISELEKRVR